MATHENISVSTVDKQQKIERFRELITEIDISKYKQKAFIKIVNAVFYELFLKPKTSISLEWNIEDVKYQAEQEGVEITDEQCSQVLLHVLRHHDASVGVSWDTISASIDRVLQIERRVSKKTGKCV